MSVVPDEVESVSEALEADHAFPAGFVWGAATAAFQIEGSTTVDGRTDSIWDEFCRRPGAVAAGDTGEPAADHYRLFENDVTLMAELGLGAYRFSVAWPRIRPDGGDVNQAGLDFYERLVDRLLENSISPWVTFYHWDLPQALEERGGWANRDTAYRFADYVEAVLGRLGDRVPVWTTLNEPWCSAFLGYASGLHAPGRTEPRAAVAAVHHLLLAHGLAMGKIRELAPNADAAITLNLFPVEPADPDSPADLEAVRRIDGLQNRLFLDPVLRGSYPSDVVEDLAPFGFADHVRDGDLDLISARLDLLGINYYRAHTVTPSDEPADGPSEWPGSEHIRFVSRGLPLTDSGWEVQPPGLVDVLVRLHREYPPIPLHITENGAAYRDVIDPDGKIRDDDRIAFLDAHLRAAHAAIELGVDLRGYFYWSLLDNFEWAEGYAKRFGIVHVDFDTQRRTPKQSARWYAQVIAGNRLPRAAG
ncbi:MAG TPA: GH1 family beta-glucosidase [Actinophytocola sp.]|uniref:GH1 family beta-glucosidase n=1 Tax=Actinophytocola sp. TaxID=1872138 RepID=UPI002DDD097B|nr:GH1 family beta-glucosidase [Actinophytocola sp.]HEV2782575.1 GH1 family beta-glucosidase [Actinophytocola sp.]